MLTEDEARKKWCPFARVWEEHGAAAAATNRHAGLKKNREGGEGLRLRSAAKCITRSCMAWHTGPQSTQEHLQGIHRGYCGLAGESK